MATTDANGGVQSIIYIRGKDAKQNTAERNNHSWQILRYYNYF